MHNQNFAIATKKILGEPPALSRRGILHPARFAVLRPPAVALEVVLVHFDDTTDPEECNPRREPRGETGPPSPSIPNGIGAGGAKPAVNPRGSQVVHDIRIMWRDDDCRDRLRTHLK